MATVVIEIGMTARRIRILLITMGKFSNGCTTCCAKLIPTIHPMAALPQVMVYEEWWMVDGRVTTAF